MIYDGQCRGGTCSPQLVQPGRHPSVRCPRHAAAWLADQMEQRGWVHIMEYGATTKVVDTAFLTMVQAVHAAGVDMEHGPVGWDDKRNVQLHGIWAPRVAGAILGVLAGKLSAQKLAEVLVKGKLDPVFGQAVDAAYKLGGKDAAHAVIFEQLPGIARELR